MASSAPPPQGNEEADFFAADPYKETSISSSGCSLSCVSSMVLNPFAVSSNVKGSNTTESREEYLAKKKIAHERYIAQKADMISKRYMTGRDKPGVDRPAGADTAKSTNRDGDNWLLTGV